MSQPIRKTVDVPKTVKPKRKRKTLSTSEIIKKNIERSKKPHPQYGTSKLEKKFAKEFLDKLDVKYEAQYFAKDIKRYYDFIVSDFILVEIDGDYYHSYGKIYEEMSPMQKRNYRVDQIKNEWARAHGFILCRIWEHDINNNPKKVWEILSEILNVENIKKNKNKRH